MKDLFMFLLLKLAKHGKIIEANMYRSGTWATIAIKRKDGIYEFTIQKKDEEKKSED